MNPLWLFRMSKWARNPPSTRRVIFVFSVIAIALCIFALEHFDLWPEALTATRMKP